MVFLWNGRLERQEVQLFFYLDFRMGETHIADFGARQMTSVTWFCSSFESSSNSDQTTTDHRVIKHCAQ